MIDPETNGTKTLNANGMGSLEMDWTFFANRYPSGSPKITPYKNPRYYVCLKCSKAVFNDVWSYESYLKSDILPYISTFYKKYKLKIYLFDFMFFIYIYFLSSQNTKK